MIISQEQVQKAVEYLKAPAGEQPPLYAARVAGGVSPELLERVRAVLDGCPETRLDRVEHARGLLNGCCPSSDEVAEKMIGRIVSDSLR